VAVLAAVAGLGFEVRSVMIRPFGFGCGGPFPSGIYSCPLVRAGQGPAGPPTAYVGFVGTLKVAALTIIPVDGSSLRAKVIAFEVPPAGWLMR
jgi:hypothetical protein